jgi:hypothetical protein
MYKDLGEKYLNFQLQMSLNMEIPGVGIFAKKLLRLSKVTVTIITCTCFP